MLFIVESTNLLRCIFVALLQSIYLRVCFAQVAAPILPNYNMSNFNSHFAFELPIKTVPIQEMSRRHAIVYETNACITQANKPAHAVNRVFKVDDLKTLHSAPGYIPNTTYWFNEYLHVVSALKMILLNIQVANV